MNKKILFITFFFPPYNCIGAVRTGKTAKGLLELGYDIRVITAKEQKLPKDLKIEIPREKILYTNWIDVNTPIYKLIGEGKVREYKNTMGKPTLKSNIIKKLKVVYAHLFHIPDQHIGWFPYAVKNAELVVKKWKPDIIFSSSMPYTSALVSNYISKKFNLPWIAELRDLWSDNHYRKGGFFDRWLEEKTLKNANALITVSDPLKDILEKKYKKFNIPVYTIQNGFDEEDFDFEIEKKEKDDKIIIVYTGSLYYGKRDPSLLFEVISANKILKDKIEIHFYGDSLFWVYDLGAKFGIKNNITVHNKVSRQEALKIQKKADLLLLLLWNDPKERGVLTGKLFEYIASRNPILGIGLQNNLAYEIINKNNFGLATNNKNEIEKFLLNFDKSKYNNNDNIRKKYSRKIQILKLSKILNSII